MKISILCTSASHPVNAHLERWIAAHCGEHQIELLRDRAALVGGDLLFLVSCGEIVPVDDRNKFTSTLVLHASDLPTGRGWNPHIWTLLAGANSITVTLLEAEDKVDSGDIWAQVVVPVPRHALWDEVNELLFSAEMSLLDEAIARFTSPHPSPQSITIEPSHFRLRTPADSRIDPTRTIEEQFDLLRLCDPNRYPAYFDLRGRRYKITLEKVGDA
jgi:methionyl-tRNA formyltransferase